MWTSAMLDPTVIRVQCSAVECRNVTVRAWDADDNEDMGTMACPIIEYERYNCENKYCMVLDVRPE